MNGFQYIRSVVVFGSMAVLLGLTGAPVLAVDKVEKTDKSVKVYKRQAVMVLPEIGLESDRVPVAVEYCSSKCSKQRGRVFKIYSSLRQKLSQQVMTWLFQKRFDVVKLENGQLKMITKQSVKAVPAHIGTFHASGLPESKWREKLEAYLNHQVAPFVLPLQKAAMEQRYREQSEQERGTFIRTQAKSLGLPMEVVSALLDSQFVMALYQPATRGKLTITYIHPQGERPYYDSDMDFDLQNKLYIYKFDSATGRFKQFKVLNGESGDTGAAIKTRSYPSENDLYGLFDNALQSALRASLIQLVHQLKDIEQFNMTQTVQSVDWRTITAALSEKDDLRIDALYRIQRSVNGKLETVGFAKVRKVAPAAKGDEQPLSEWIVVKGEAEVYDKLSETSWMGAYWGVDLIAQDYQFKTINGATVLKPDQKMNWLRWQARIDRGYFENNPELSESWLAMYVAFGVSDGDLKTDVAYQSWKNPIGIKLGADFLNHNTLGRGWSAGYGFGLEGYYFAANSTQENGDAFGYFSLDLLARLELNYLIDTKNQLSLYAGYPVSLLHQAKIGDVEVNASLTPGLMVGLSYQRTFSTLGFLHRFFDR